MNSIPPIFFQIPNWADSLTMFLFGTYFVILEAIAVMIGLWAIAELGFVIYKRLNNRYRSIVLHLSI